MSARIASGARRTRGSTCAIEDPLSGAGIAMSNTVNDAIAMKNVTPGTAMSQIG
jgi:hypothetical protein